MILEYKIACDNCNCIIDGIKADFIRRPIDGDFDYGAEDFCANNYCDEGKTCPKCGANVETKEVKK